MAARITSESCEMRGIRSEIGNTGVDQPLGALHELTESRGLSRGTGELKHESKSFLDEIPDLATAQCSLGFSPAIKIIGYFDRGFHER
jgi:hypothetical protein